jgi:hypothetical protein
VHHAHTVDVNELLMTAVRALAVYVLMLVVIRALGRRTVGNISAFDLLVALVLGEIGALRTQGVRDMREVESRLHLRAARYGGQVGEAGQAVICQRPERARRIASLNCGISSGFRDV